MANQLQIARFVGCQVQQLLSPSPGLAAALRQRAGRYGHSAVHRAALHGHAEVVRELLRARAELSRDDEGGEYDWVNPWG
jgi:ankyrin repeat protein